MGRYASENDGNFKPAPAGTHVARCIRLIDLGTQEQEYEGKVSHQQKIMLVWELPEELMDDGKPFMVSKWYTNSLGEKATLRKDLAAWRARDFTPEELRKFDLQSVLNAPCLLTVKHSEKGRAQIAGVAKVTKGTTVPAAVNEVFAFWLNEEDFSLVTLDKLSEKLQETIKKSPEYQSRMDAGGTEKKEPATTADIEDEDIPF